MKRDASFLAVFAACLILAAVAVSSRSPDLIVENAAYAHARAIPTASDPVQSEIIQDEVIAETPDERLANLWAIIYLWGLTVGLVITAVGIAATFQQKHYSDRVAAFQKLQIAGARDRASAADQRAAEAIERAAKIEAEAAPRDVGSPTQGVINLGKLNTGLVEIVSYAGDAEGARLATQIIKLLNNTGFKLLDNSLTKTAMKPLAFGIQVTGADANLISVLSAWLDQSHLLRPAPPSPNTGVMMTGSSGLVRTNEPSAATIFVGSKPLPQMP